jgi:hypothetical protein
MHDPKIIEPDPDGGYKPAPKVWVAAWIILILMWAGFLFSFAVDWKAVILGFGTGLIFTGWAVDITGNKTPEFMKSPRKTGQPEWPPRP